MLNKEASVAVMTAVMLVAASIFGGPILPASATHDHDAVQLEITQVTKEDDGSTVLDAVELTAKKSTMRASGTITIEIVQNGTVLESATVGTSSLDTTFDTIEVGLPNTSVTGSFDILVEYLGSGRITISDVEPVEVTETSGGNDETPGGGNEGNENEAPDIQPQPDLENMIANVTISLGNNETSAIEAVHFTAKKSTMRASGQLEIAMMQDGDILDVKTMSTRDLDTSYKEFEAEFDIEVQDDIQVVFMYEGSGVVKVNSIDVVGETATSEDEEPAEPEGPDTETPSTGSPGMITLTVNAIDQNNQPITDMWVAVLQGMTLVDSDFTQAEFSLDANKTYTVEMGDFFDEESGTLYEFNGWADSVQDNRRTAGLNDNELFTARYVVTTGASPPTPTPQDPNTEPTSPPPSSGSGTIAAFAYRIPSEHWGPTFVGANAQMYFVLYNSTGYLVHTGFFDENGHTVTGLNDGETYWIYPTDCEECHDDPHDVVFHHWQDSNTERPRAITPGTSVGAYYEYIPPS